MRVVITGAKGFIGKELTAQCEKQGIEAICVDVIDNNENNYYKISINSDRIVEIIPEQCDALVHLAALSRDKDCKNNAINCFRVNVMGTLNLIEAAQKRNVKNFIFASTEWVYDKFLENEIKDEDSLIDISNQKSEYALSKLVSEVNLRQKYNHSFCNVTILRFGIIYGPRKSDWSAVESIFNSVATRDELTVGSLKTGRHFIYVSDIASAIIKSIGLKGLEILNVQGDRLITLGDIIETSKKILGRNPIIRESSPGNPSVRRVSNKKVKELLGWKPDIDLEKGLKSIMNFLGFEKS